MAPNNTLCSTLNPLENLNFEKFKFEKLKTSICKRCLYDSKSCICKPEWDSFINSIRTAVKGYDSLKPQRLNVSTITTNFKLSNCTLNLDAFAKNFEANDVFKILRDYVKEGRKHRKKEINNNMYNQCEVKGRLKEYKCAKGSFGGKCKVLRGCCMTNVSLMIFRNGAMKMTGIRNPKNLVKIVRTIDRMIRKTDAVTKLDKNSPCRMTDLRISMVNTNFSMDVNIKQEMLNDFFNSEPSRLENGGCIKYSSFDRDRYPGINTKYVYRKIYDPSRKEYDDYVSSKKKESKKRILRQGHFFTRKGRVKLQGELSILTFSTGAVIITGGKRIDEIRSAYTYILDLLKTHPEFTYIKTDQDREEAAERTQKKRLRGRNVYQGQLLEMY